MSDGTPADGPADGPGDTPADDPLRLAREIADAYRGNATPDQQPRRPRRRARSRRPGREDATPLADVMSELVQQQGWTDQLAAQRVFTDWAGIVGPEVARHCVVEGYADQVVHIAADSSAWRKELQLLAPTIVARLNAELGDGSVLRIEVRGPQAPSWKSGPRSIRGARGPRDTYG
ncbi:hypothetical protein HMPREF0063_10419 [Aeromicrobium marinum DSM 15272]|uniref:DUF721 domain-containing protein n=1 Tax=Aeromicrobium marinum DSM 15272 TaxID=585531 RepID=E2S8R2_9ACTN|nr:DciA family protein [Aeromicrobium marinum]EFQ84567.1 hypothetical protein HMPREF0063_10419 [Aeromicrobium marinum DSM 15272]